MGSHITKPSNKTMVDRLVEHNSYIRSPAVEGAFRAVDRAMYFDLEEGEAIDPYEDDPWRRGNLHLSAPCIYAKVVEALDLRSGLSFLNLGSGTGYLNTIVGLLVGPNGLNHGVELHADVVEYAYDRLQQFKQNSHAIDKYDFSEPVFIKGNCLNLNPNSKYDRIYLGAACLPDLENFMKKLIKPSGGILVMPYENHLVRYIRITETEWRSEKLMDVNFTLMIRQSDNEAVIDMPPAQVKSLKELCRINIRQHLRGKTDYLNPNLLHSDNISSRRMRKAKAERKMLRRVEQRAKSVNRDPIFSVNRARRTTKSPTKRPRSGRSVDSRQTNRECRCRRMVEEIEEPTSLARESQRPSTSTASRLRVMTRSASRRMENLVRSPNTSTGSVDNHPEQGNSSRAASSNGYNLRTSSGSDSSDSDEDDVHPATSETNTTNNTASTAAEPDSNNCARTRPFVCTMRNRPSLAIPSAYRSSLSATGPNPLLPLQRRMARLIDPPTSSSSSDSSNDYQEIEEYDYIGRRVVLDWPGFLRIRDTDPTYQDDMIDSRSDSSDSTLSSNNEDLILNDSSSSDSWDSFFDNFHNNYDTMDDDPGEVDEVSSFMSSEDTNPDDQDCDFNFESGDDLPSNADYNPTNSGLDHEQDNPSTSFNSRHSTSSSRCQSREQNDTFRSVSRPKSRSARSDAKRPKNEKNSDQQPVATRLRSKRLSQGNDLDDIASQSPVDTASSQTILTDPADRPLPSCSRGEPRRGISSHSSDCPIHLTPRRRNVCAQRRSRSSARESTSLSAPSSSSSIANRSTARESNASESADYMGNPSQGLFTGRVLIATALGTTLSLAARNYHHLPTTNHNGSFRLFERRTLNNLAPTRHHLLQQSERKRKRHSSSESSSSSESLSPDRARSRSRPRCSCSRQSHSIENRRSRGHKDRAEVTTRSTSTADDANSSEQEIAQPTSVITSSSGRRRTQATASQTDDNSTIAQSNSALSSNEGRTSSRSDSGHADNSDTWRREILDGLRQRRFNHSQNISRQKRHHHHHHHRCQHDRSSHRHRRGHTCQQWDNKRSNRRVESGDRQDKRRKTQSGTGRRLADECARYHNHLSVYIRQLPLPRVLLSYLNYERDL